MRVPAGHSFFRKQRRITATADLMVKWFSVFIAVLFCIGAKAQTQQGKADTVVHKAVAPLLSDSAQVADSLRRRRARKAIIHSAIIPGWGQINNRQFWKAPAAVAVAAIPAYLFFDNVKVYRGLRQAYIYRLDTIPSNDALIPARYAPLSDNSLKYYRDAYRKNVDLSVLAFIIGWGLNVADAAVFAHLRDFDVSDQLAMRIRPNYNPLNKSGQLTLCFQSSSQGRTAARTKKISELITR